MYTYKKWWIRKKYLMFKWEFVFCVQVFKIFRIGESLIWLQAIWALFLFCMKMRNKGFDIWLIPEFSSVATDLLIVEWVKNVGLVYKIKWKNLRARPLAVYQQMIKDQRSDAEQIKQALITTYLVNAFDPFMAWQLHPGKIDEFLVELKHLALLVRGLLPKW